MGEERGSRESQKGRKEHEMLQKNTCDWMFQSTGRKKRFGDFWRFFPQKVRGESNKYLQSFLRLKTTTQKYP